MFGIITLSFGALVGTIFCGGPEGREKELTALRDNAISYNGVSVCFWHTPWLILWGSWWLITHIPVGLRFAWTFLWKFFRLIHSDERLLCGVNAAIGAGVGYLTGNALVGALVGGLIGVANYEIVSKRVFKFVPAKS